MKKIIRLTESDLHNIVKKSVNRILREEEGNRLPYPNDEYNEFDRGAFDEEPDDYYEYAQRFYDGDYSNEVINKLIQGCYDGEDEAISAYEYAKSKDICPDFVKKVENDKSWTQFNSDAYGAELDRKRALGGAYYDSWNQDPYADAEDETTNRFNAMKSPFVKKGARKGKEDKYLYPNINGTHMGVAAQGDENDRLTRFARKFNGTRRSIPRNF